MNKYFASISLLSVCLILGNGNNQASEDAQFRTDETAIMSLIDLTCDHDNQCKLIAVGVSACGGPQKYLAYSVKNSDVSKLKSTVALFNGKQRLQNKKNSTVGTCNEIMPPKTFCAKSSCQTSAINHVLKKR